jgi:hypothetical protein
MSERRHAERLTLNASNTRRATHDGREHLVVPAVVLVEGVLNEGLVLAEEFSKFHEAWNGVPVPVLHPEVNGVPISANSPEVIERQTVGRFYNVSVDGNKLKGEMWLDVAKCEANLIRHLESGGLLEVSTGYLCDAEAISGEWNGRPYKEVHRNIHPDHIALLPGEIGACSIEDGCGVGRTNNRTITMKINEAVETIRRALGLRSNCNCEDNHMPTLKDMAEKLKKNSVLDAAEYKKITDALGAIPEDKMDAVAALVQAYLTTEAPAAAAEDVPDEEPAFMEEAGQIQKNSADIDKIVANKVAEHLRRHAVTEKLKTNERCPFSEDDMKAMSVEHLEKLEQSIRPVDYSGAGAYAVNSGSDNVTPLVLPRGVLAKKEA